MIDATNPFLKHPRWLSRLPRVVRVYALSVLVGFCLAGAFTGLLLGFDVAGLYRLVTTVDGGLLAVVLLVFFNGIVFSGVQFGIVVMSMDYPDKPGRPRRKPTRLSKVYASGTHARPRP
jgi:hypothetical protein